MEKLQIFEGISVTVKEAEDLALYWKAAGDSVATINSKGHLETSDRVWKRPLADKNFKALKEALSGSNVHWIKVYDDHIEVDFSELKYNHEWLRKIIAKHKLGVSNCTYGLLMFAPQNANGETWYSQQSWELKRVTVESLGLTHKETSPTSPNPNNPRTAEWRSLYFAS